MGEIVLPDFQTISGDKTREMEKLLNRPAADQNTPDLVYAPCIVPETKCPGNCATCQFASADHVLFNTALASSGETRFMGKECDPAKQILVSGYRTDEAAIALKHFIPGQADDLQRGTILFVLPAELGALTSPKEE